MDIEQFPISEAAKRMLGYVTGYGFYDNSYVGKWIFQVMGTELDDARTVIEELPLQAFVETATWGLMYHEMKWGLPVMESLPVEERRRKIYEKRDLAMPVCPYHIETYVHKVMGLEVSVADCHDPGIYDFTTRHPNTFMVQIDQNGDDLGMESKKLKEILDRMKQSHTMYLLQYRIFVWARLVTEIQATKLQLCMGIMPRDKSNFIDSKWYLDGGYPLDGTMRLDGYIGTYTDQDLYEAAEQFGLGVISPVTYEGSMIMRRLWFLDGSYNLDGGRQINAEERTIIL